MDLDSVIQSEVNKIERNKYHLLTHVCGIQKDGTFEPVCMVGIEMQMQRMDMWTWGRENEWGQLERVALIYIHTMCKIASQWEAVVYTQEPQPGVL